MESLLIGGIAGIVSRTLTAPVELLKMQQQNRFIPNTTLREVVRIEGITGLWKGNFTNCVRIFPQMSINYGLYSFIQRLVNEYGDNGHNSHNGENKIKGNKNIINFMSGGISGAVAMSIIYPMETIRSRLSLQTGREQYKGIIDVIQKTPMRQLYNGLGMSLIGFAPYNALNFMFYNYYNDGLKKVIFTGDSGDSGDDKKNKVAMNLLAGGIAGISAVSFTYPSDLIRRRLQLQGSDKSVPVYNGIIDCCNKIIRSEGIVGLYRGLGACYIKIFPANAIQFMVISFLSDL